ncbi:hypothetical protein ACWD4L_32730 [Streptomyces sp. NPDC002596]
MPDRHREREDQPHRLRRHPAQTWQPGIDGSLLNPASGRCLTVPGSDIANGTPAELGDCDGTVNQK